MQDLKNSNWIILAFKGNNSDTLKIILHTFCQSLSNNKETFRDTFTPDTFCQSSYKSILAFSEITTKQYYTHFSEFILHNTLSGN